MIVFPNAKINLGLQITGKRSDGYHNLETIFYPIPWKDALEILPDPKGDDVNFSQSGLSIDGPLTKNLCVRAYRLLKEKYPELPAIQLHLLKHIPMGAGLGGGSADATWTLQLLNQLFDLRISPEQLAEWSLELGSDCPFFMFNKPAFAHGRGEHLIPLEARLKGKHILIVHPGIHVSTAWAFQSITLKKHHSDLKTIYAGPMERWQHDLVNDFEEPVFSAYPIIGTLKQQMLDAGAMYASMSGSGSSVFGIFHQVTDIPMQTDFAHRWMKLS